MPVRLRFFRGLVRAYALGFRIGCSIRRPRVSCCPSDAFAWCCLLRLFLVTTVLVLVPALLGMPLLGWFAAVLHLAGRTGDMAYVRIIAREPMATHVEDTERGISLLHDE